MKKEHKTLTGITIGASVLVIGGLLTWGTTQSTTDATQNVTLERLHTRQESIIVDVQEIRIEQGRQADKLDQILIEVVKRNGGVPSQ